MQVPCPLNSSHSFWPILLKLYMGFQDGLKICMRFFQNHEIIFYYFFRIFNWDIFFSSNTTEVCREQVPCLLNSSHSFWPILLKLYRCFKDGLKICMWFFQNPEIIFYHFLHVLNRHFLSSNITEVYREYVACPLNSSHSFWPILLKLYVCFKDGLKICRWIFQNPEIFFYYFFRIFNLDIFWVLILQKCIGCRYLVPLTPPTVFVRSFWNFTRAFRMAWRYACVFFQNPEIIFYHFFCIFKLDIFLVLILQKRIGSRYLDPVTPTTVLSRSFETLQVL